MIIGFIGFGELASCFVKGLRKELDSIKFFAYDSNYSFAKEKADVFGVEIVRELSDLFNCADNIIVAVPGDVDSKVFEEISSLNVKNKLFMDFSTSLPDVKKSISLIIEKKQCDYIDVAVLGSVPKLLHKTPLLVSGEQAEKMVKLFDGCDMNISVCSKEVGKASTIKLCRSIFMKGLPALLIETKRTCNKYGVEEEVFNSIYENLKNQSFDTFCDRLINGAYNHTLRQRNEIKECIMLEEKAGVSSNMTQASYNTFNELLENSKNG